VPTTQLPPNHDRVCMLANGALETLIAKEKHQQKCPQCRTDPRWCDTSRDYDTEFLRTFSAWRANRPTGGVTLPLPRKDVNERQPERV